MKLSQNAISAVARKALDAASGPARVIVFGSYARDEAEDDSDLDLLVIESQLTNYESEYLKLRSAIGRIGVGVDLLLLSQDDFSKRSLVPGTLPYWAAKEGKLLYERAD